MFQQLINYNFGKCVEGKKKVQPIQLCLHITYSSTQNVGPGGGGRGIQNNTKKTNQLLGSPLTDEPENRKQTSGVSNYSHIVADDDDGKQEVQTFLPGQQLVIIVLLVISRPVVHHFPLGTRFCARTRKQHKSHLLWVFFAECLVQVFRFHLVAVVALPVLSSWAVHLRPPTAAPRCSDRLCGVCLHQEHDKHLFLQNVGHIGCSVTSFPVLEHKFFL